MDRVVEGCISTPCSVRCGLMCFGGHHLIRDVIRRLVPGEHRAGPAVRSLSEPGRIRHLRSAWKPPGAVGIDTPDSKLPDMSISYQQPADSIGEKGLVNDKNT